MQTQFSAGFLATENGQIANDIIRKCVHCGFCNATCPTYQLLGDELDGPRGRIYLIKDLLETGQNTELAKHHLDRCLTCKSCETTCPSGVSYSHLAEIGRETIAEREPLKDWFERFVLFVVPRHKLFRALVRIGRMFRMFAPRRLRGFLRNKPAKKSKLSAKHGDVLLLQGCVQRSMTPDVVTHVKKLLEDRNTLVRTEDSESCCGGLHHHVGQREKAILMMNRFITQIDSADTKQIVSSASGCGAVLKDYGRIVGSLAAKTFSTKVMDVSELLLDHAFEKNTRHKRVAIHSPCSLSHGLRLEHNVERILAATGYDLVATRNTHLCCGSAGTYSMFQSEIADELRSQKLADLTTQQTRCDRHGKHWMPVTSCARG